MQAGSTSDTLEDGPPTGATDLDEPEPPERVAAPEIAAGSLRRTGGSEARAWKRTGGSLALPTHGSALAQCGSTTLRAREEASPSDRTRRVHSRHRRGTRGGGRLCRAALASRQHRPSPVCATEERWIADRIGRVTLFAELIGYRAAGSGDGATSDGGVPAGITIGGPIVADGVGICARPFLTQRTQVRSAAAS